MSTDTSRVPTVKELKAYELAYLAGERVLSLEKSPVSDFQWTVATGLTISYETEIFEPTEVKPSADGIFQNQDREKLLSVFFAMAEHFESVQRHLDLVAIKYGMDQALRVLRFFHRLEETMVQIDVTYLQRYCEGARSEWRKQLPRGRGAIKIIIRTYLKKVDSTGGPVQFMKWLESGVWGGKYSVSEMPIEAASVEWIGNDASLPFYESELSLTFPNGESGSYKANSIGTLFSEVRKEIRQETTEYPRV